MLVVMNIHTHGHKPGDVAEIDDEIGMDLADAGLITVISGEIPSSKFEAPVVLTYAAPDVLQTDPEHTDEPSADGHPARRPRASKSTDQRVGTETRGNSLG